MEDMTSRVEAIQSRLSVLEVVLGRLGQLTMSSPTVLVYPEPLSTALAGESGARLHHERFFSLLDAGEVCIQYTGVVAMALCRLSEDDLDVQREFRQPISLGRWAELVRDLCNSGGMSYTAIGRDLKSSLFRLNGRPTPTGRYWLEEFINLRNRERGHGSSLPDQAYEALHLRHVIEVYDALEACSYLKYPLVRVESVDVVTKPITYDIRLLVGPPPLTITKRIQSVTHVRLGATCVWDRDETLVDLGELLIYRSCPTCSIEHTFFLEKWTDNTRFYRAYLGNHRFRDSG